MHLAPPTQQIAAHHSQTQALRAARGLAPLREPTADEVTLVAEALSMGAVLDGWSDYLTGERSSLPVRFQTYVHCEDFGDAHITAAAERMERARDAYLVRVKAGDLSAVAARVQGSSFAKAA